jgi:rhodanese-related sulfurtransferase
VQLFRIGFDDVPGYLDGGMDAWIASGRPTRSYPVATLDDLIGEARLGGRAILDVRQRNEWEQGHLPGSRHTFVGDLPRRIHELLGLDTVMVACATGHRSAIAASMLDAADVPVRLVARDGVPAALRRLG